MVGRGIGHHLEIVGGVLVVRRHEEGHDPLKEGLRCSVVAEQGVAVDVVEVAVFFRRAT